MSNLTIYEYQIVFVIRMYKKFISSNFCFAPISRSIADSYLFLLNCKMFITKVVTLLSYKVLKTHIKTKTIQDVLIWRRFLFLEFIVSAQWFFYISMHYFVLSNNIWDTKLYTVNFYHGNKEKRNQVWFKF